MLPAKPITRQDIAHLFDLPLMDLLMQAQSVHRRHFNANEVQISTLLSIKTGNCPEDCGYSQDIIVIKQDWSPKNALKSKRFWHQPSVPKCQAHLAFAWGRRGNIHQPRICLTLWSLSVRLRHWDLRRA